MELVSINNISELLALSNVHVCHRPWGNRGGGFYSTFLFPHPPSSSFWWGEEEMVAAAQKRFLLFHFHPLREKRLPASPPGPIRTHLLFPPQRFSVSISKKMVIYQSLGVVLLFSAYLLLIYEEEVTGDIVKDTQKRWLEIYTKVSYVLQTQCIFGKAWWCLASSCYSSVV